MLHVDTYRLITWAKCTLQQNDIIFIYNKSRNEIAYGSKVNFVNRKLTKHNIRKFDIHGPCERVAMTVCGSHKSIRLDSSCIFCHVSLISAGPHEVILIRLFVQPIQIPHVFFLYQCIFFCKFHSLSQQYISSRSFLVRRPA